MSDKRQRRKYVSQLTRAQINQLCSELQAIVRNFQTFLAETHGYSEPEIAKIMAGTKFEDLETIADSVGDEPSEESTVSQKFTQPNPADLHRLKQEDEYLRRSMMFELEWCLTQVERNQYPH